mgnify:CR=1 FL=1
MKDFSRTSQKTNNRPVVNCLLMNLSVQKNVTVLPESRKGHPEESAPTRTDRMSTW